MAQTTQRAFALSLAILFIVTTVGFSGFVIWQMYDESKKSKDTSQTDSSQTADQAAQEDPLKGSQLENYTPVENVTELKIEDIVVGDGDEAKAGSTVTAHYTGALASTGVIFESSLNSEPATFPLDSVITGWGEGVPGMKVGGKRRLIIPADKAYGEQSPSPDIPANSALVFDIELIAVQQQKTQHIAY